jgi:osmotically inducible protein OsmC
MTIKKSASAIWKGNLTSGTGTISTQSGALSAQPYGFNTRFEDKAGTNPEELVGAAHAGCFSMALSNILGESNFKADSIETHAEVSLDKTDGGFSITAIHLTTVAKIPGIDQDTFTAAATKAKENCPISKVLNTKITLNAKLS